MGIIHCLCLSCSNEIYIVWILQKVDQPSKKCTDKIHTEWIGTIRYYTLYPSEPFAQNIQCMSVNGSTERLTDPATIVIQNILMWFCWPIRSVHCMSLHKRESPPSLSFGPSGHHLPYSGFPCIHSATFSWMNAQKSWIRERVNFLPNRR